MGLGGGGGESTVVPTLWRAYMYAFINVDNYFERQHTDVPYFETKYTGFKIHQFR